MTYLLHKNVEPKQAFTIMELTRKGKVAKGGFPEGVEDMLRQHDVPEWYLDSCKKDKVHVPEGACRGIPDCGHPADVVQGYHPLAFYATHFTVRGDDIDYECRGGRYEKKNINLKEVKAR